MIHIITGNYRAQIIHGFVSKKDNTWFHQASQQNHGTFTQHQKDNTWVHLASTATMAKAAV
jgi:uncharacterized pyridoxamine 5'-phosphate oxidase family protein